MNRIEAIVGTMLMLILVYLLLNNANSVKTIFNSLAGATMGVFGTLQGRDKSDIITQVGGGF